MIIELRTYTAAVGRAVEFLNYFGQHGLDIQLRNLGTLVFCGTTELGPLNQIVSVWAYNSFAEREQKRAALMRDPEWQEYLKKQPTDWLLSQDVKIVNPMPFSPLR
jgi:NIPSNAP